MAPKATVALLVVALAAGALAGLPVPTQPEVEALPCEQAAAILQELLWGPEAAGSEGFWKVQDAVKEVLEQLKEAAREGAAQEAGPLGMYTDFINQQLEKVKKVMREGWPETGLPALDPLQLPHAEWHLHNFDGALDNIQITGLSDFIVDLFRVTIIDHSLYFKFEFNTHMNNVTVSGQYNLTSTLPGLLPIYGAGPMVITFADLQLSSESAIRVDEFVDKYLEFEFWDLDYAMGEYHSEFGGLLGGGPISHIINAAINDAVPKIVAGSEKVVSSFVAKILGKLIDSLLNAWLKSLDPSFNM